MLEFVGYIAATLGAFSLAPEIKKALKTHHLRDVSWWMVLLSLTGSILWELYGLHIGNLPIILSDALNILLSIFLIVLKLRYVKYDQPLLLKAEEAEK
jgi:uncharacterized protein with PQ loop repeat